ncbi:hypothetical protein I3760_03G100100 [Carya illinoinensis]|nr:hypothetical protein I3760_03G100100 [Carya illinoinensis]
MKLNIGFVVVVLALLTSAPLSINAQERLLVPMTVVRNAFALGAFCLDGSLPAYHLHKGFGAGTNNWLLQFEGGGWCNDLASCFERANTHRGSTSLMTKFEVFFGILNNNASFNPGIGQKIWEAIIHDLLPKGLVRTRMALLSGCSAGGLASFLHCQNFTNYLPENASVKCLSDPGFFLDKRDISLNYTMRSFYKNLVSLQFHHILVPPSSDLHGHWNHCKLNPVACDENQIETLQVFLLTYLLNPSACVPHLSFRRDIILTLRVFFKYSRRGGMFINSCFAHCQSESQDTWFGDDSSRIQNKYFSRRVTKEIDCAYPCDSTCHNLIP